MGNHSWQTHRVVGYRKVATVGNLDLDTIYQFAILPENMLGSGQFSKEIMAKTKSKFWKFDMRLQTPFKRN